MLETFKKKLQEAKRKEWDNAEHYWQYSRREAVAEARGFAQACQMIANDDLAHYDYDQKKECEAVVELARKNGLI